MPSSAVPPTESPTRAVVRVRPWLERVWRASPPLAAVSALMLAAAAPAIVGLVADPRVVTGAPVWLKPFKFAVSAAIYGVTLGWILTRLPDRPRTRRIAGGTTAVAFALEVAIIGVQAARGTTSHFNMSTPLDGALFTVMAAAILLQTLVSVAVAVALWRQRFVERALGWALRLGMSLTIVGALTGGLMTRPTEAQLARAQAGGGMPAVGAHTVGGADGGAGVPVTGWSRAHGDLRVPHFVGLHAIQALALVAVLLRRWRRPEAVRVRAMLAVAAAHAALFVLLLTESLRGRSVVAPEGPTLVALLVWASATALLLAWIARGTRGRSRADRADLVPSVGARPAAVARLPR